MTAIRDLFAVLLVVACGLLTPRIAHAQAQPVPRLWTDNCASCHGERGEGAGAESLLRPEKLAAGFDRRFFETIRDGRADDGMPEFRAAFSDEQIWGLVVYIRELQAQEFRRQTPPRKPDGQGVVATTHHRFRVEPVIAQGLSIPWSLAFAPGNRMLIAERPGTLRIYDRQRLSEPVHDTPQVKHGGQGGLMDVALHPDYASNGWVYLSYTHEDGGLMTRVVRGRIAEHRWTDEQVIFEAPRAMYLPTRHHFGCRLVFDGQGHLFFSIGDRGRGPHAQDLSRPNGKIHRVRDDGRVPEDNPFAGNPAAMGSIWSPGHRNPQGMVLDADAGQLWITDHGPRGGDELNLVKRGGNYGWPLVSYGINYNGTPFQTPWSDRDFVEPVLRWIPSIAACGLDQVRGDAFPQWRGDLLAGGLAGQVVERLRLRDGKVVEREPIIERIGRVRDVVCAPDGTIYLALNGPDQVVRLVPAEGR